MTGRGSRTSPQILGRARHDRAGLQNVSPDSGESASFMTLGGVAERLPRFRGKGVPAPPLGGLDPVR